jgi:SAM-dependent methyltransferase
MTSGDVLERMRSDWNARAREDAHYYVAFGRRGQHEDEFFATAHEIATSLEAELRRLPSAEPSARRALEIGCGPGRLMRPLSRHFGEIHGVDISDEMIRLARERLADIPHAHPRHNPSSDLAAYAAESFDFVYSYAVFQHIPDREVVFNYFRETRRVLKIGGIARFQVNGLPESAPQYDTWCGVRIGAADLAAFARDNDFQLLALEGVATQYLWTTWKKQPPGWVASLSALPKPAPAATIRRITNAFSGEPLAPARGRFASISLWMAGLPPESDLNFLRVTIGGAEGFVTYIGPPAPDGLQQVNVLLPQGLGTGLQPVAVFWCGRELCPPAALRVTRPGPAVPHVTSVTDGIDLLSSRRIVTGIIKVVIEETDQPGLVEATLGGCRLPLLDHFCTDPRLPKYELNFRVPPEAPRGRQLLELRLGRRRFPPVELEVEAGRS